MLLGQELIKTDGYLTNDHYVVVGIRSFYHPKFPQRLIRA